MKRLPLAAAVTSLLLTSCAGGGGEPGLPASTAPNETTTTRPPPPVPATDLPEPRPSLLAAIVLFPGELPEPYTDLPFDTIESGYRPAGADLAHALDPADEADDIVRYGFLADLTTAYGTVDSLSLAIEAVDFATADGAGGYMADWVADLEAASAESGGDGIADFSSTPLSGLGDEAVRIDYATTYQISEGDSRARPGAALAIRSGRLVAWVWASGEGAGEALDALGGLMAERLEGAVTGTLPPREPGLLGLSDPPTALLRSFVFDYRYGLDSGEGSFEIAVEGTFVAPDRTECRIQSDLSGGEPTALYVVATGNRVWIGGQTGYTETPLWDPAALNALSACPGHPLFWEITRFHRLPTDGAQPAQIRDIEVLETDLAGNRVALGRLGYLADEADQITRYEVAVAADGGWLVELRTERETDLPTAMMSFGLEAASAHPGIPATVYDVLMIEHPDDPSLRVDPPLLAG